MDKRDIGREVLEGLQEIKAYQVGVGDLRSRTLYPPPPASEIRAQLNLSQAAFAGLMGVSLRTLQDWEQGRRQPAGSARMLLRIAQQHPEVFLDLA
jgi:putative transcriptional regulator